KLGLKGPIILSLGRIASYKGVEHIIRAYKITKTVIPQLNLIIGGSPDFIMKDKYEQWMKKHKDVIFTGYLEENEVPIYYTMADIFINYSSSSEGFGLTPLEAIACGTPVICSDLKVFREVFQDKVQFVQPNDPEKLAKTIQDLINNDNLKLKLIKDSKSLLQIYSWSNSGERFEQLYYKFYNESINL
ncbi:MAG: glycosyltransferase, partial [Candidatus Thorarchaeota archaeon]